MNEETLEDTIIRLNKESSNYESLLHLEQKKNKAFFDTIKTIPIKHYEQDTYVDLIESIFNNIFKEDINEQLGKMINSGQFFDKKDK
tara:strand:- start:92 stop:352 length:261 start_codon:yes stop_codon:yes gene_type:complete